MIERWFAVGILTALGCSNEYAEAIADRVLAPNALLNAGDAEWLRRIRNAQRATITAASLRWSNAN